MTIHLVEPGGRGGVFQHTLALAAALAQKGSRVKLHTASDVEEVAPGFELCPCVDWKRSLARGRRRSASVASSFAVRTIPHLARDVQRQDIVHVQGLFGGALTTATLLAGRIAGARVIHSPHNTFSRAGKRAEELLLALDARLAAVTIAFSQADHDILSRRRVNAVLSPLTQYMPPASDGAPGHWREAWASGGLPVVLFAGQVRPDKRLDLLLRAAATRKDRWRVVVVGEDKGALEPARRLASDLMLEVTWHVGYPDLSDFIAAIAAADVVACPYEQASQSGVLALARQLGVRSVSSRVGGLAEIATASFEPGDFRGLAGAIDRVLSSDAPGQCLDVEELLRAHCAAYRP